MRREARLKPEYAHLYPGVEPGVWESAAVLADRVLSARLLGPSSGFVLSDRALAMEHFEFRGGSRQRIAAPAPTNDAADPRAARTEGVGSGQEF
ncbi:MAG TPA: hypothetical protein VH763_11350 [Gemmatimonadales bacterium]|jgi:hypothetical protein